MLIQWAIQKVFHIKNIAIAQLQIAVAFKKKPIFYKNNASLYKAKRNGLKPFKTDGIDWFSIIYLKFHPSYNINLMIMFMLIIIYGNGLATEEITAIIKKHI